MAPTLVNSSQVDDLRDIQRLLEVIVGDLLSTLPIILVDLGIRDPLLGKRILLGFKL